MAQFIGLVTLNAANFDSGAAGDGEVLTADGAGNAAWEAAGGGGGASFLFDGAILTVGTYDSENGNWPITVELTLGGTPISTSPAFWSWVTNSSGIIVSSGNAYVTHSEASAFINIPKFADPNHYDQLVMVIYPGTSYVALGYPVNNRYKLNVLLPSGEIVQSGYFGYEPE